MDPAVYVAIVGIAVTALIAVLAGSIRTGISHIRIRTKIECDAQHNEINRKLDTLIINVAEVGAVGERVYRMEQKIGNGLGADLKAVQIQVAQMHGWMEAQNGTT